MKPKKKSTQSHKRTYKKKIASSVQKSHKIRRILKKIFVAEFFILPFLIMNALLLVGIGFLQDATVKNNRKINEQLLLPSITIPKLAHPQELPISARSYIVYDPEARVIIEGKNEFLQFAPASATKIMTALVALEYYQVDDILIARNMNTVKGSKMGLIEGEAITVESLLYGLMLPSGNDAAYVLARSYPDGVVGFLNRMNQKAADLKLINTYFVDPSGYQDENYTTAFDLARLAGYALKNATFAEVVKTPFTVVTNSTGRTQFQLTNLNQLLYDPSVIGVKTGFTDEAGGVLVTGYVYEGRTYITVVLKSEDRFFDTQQILYGLVPEITLVRYGGVSYR